MLHRCLRTISPPRHIQSCSSIQEHIDSMARSTMLSSLLFSALGAAMPDKLLEARQIAGTACGARGRALSSCLGNGGSAFCSAFLAPKTVALRYCCTYLQQTSSSVTIK